jgi:nucleoside-diphosphate-sugar epimerase
MAAGKDRVLITGGSGFIGACLARDLIAEGHDVHLLLRPESKQWRLAGLAGRYTTHWADLRDAVAIRQAVISCQPEVIYHLATHGAYPFQTSRAAILATNLTGTANLLEALKDHDYRALVYTGSSSEYGHKNGPMREDDRLEPRSDYAVLKAAATLLCQAEAYQGRPIITVRVFSAYGPWEEPTRLVPYVMDCCARGVNPGVTSGWQPRDFVYSDDVVSLLKLAASKPELASRILHAGTGRQHSVRDMVETIIAICGRGKVQALFGSEPVRPDEPASWVANIDETSRLTGWTPVHDLRSGISRMWEWYNNERRRIAA